MQKFFSGMIKEISISNYKSILYQKFSLARVNVFVGQSGSGKTNIFESLAMAAAAHDDSLDAVSLTNRGVRVTKPSLMFHSSEGHERHEEIEVTWNEKQSVKKAKLVCDNPDSDSASWKDISWFEPAYVEKLNNLIRFIGDGSDKEQYPFEDESKNAVLNAAFRGSRSFRDYLIYHVNIDALRGATSEGRNFPLGIHGENLHRLIYSFNDEQLREINSCFPGKYRLHNSTGFSIENCDDQTLFLLFYMALFISRHTPGFFAVDAFDVPGVSNEVMKTITYLAVKNNKQTLIATNQPAIVEGMNLADPEQKLFLVKKNDNGETIVKTLKDKTF